MEVSESGEDANFIKELWPLVIVILLDFENVNNRDSSGFWKCKFKSPNKSGGYSGEQVRW